MVRVRGPHQHQAEVDVLQRQPDRIFIARVKLVDDAVNAVERRSRIGGIVRIRVLIVLEVWAAAHEHVHAACAEGIHAHVKLRLGGVAQRQAQVVLLCEGEASRDVHVLADGQRRVLDRHPQQGR